VSPEDVVARLAAAGCVAAEAEAAELVAAAPAPAALAAMIDRRARGEPLPWILGSVSFCGLRLGIRPGVYVPRWHTERLARRAAARLPEGGVAVDVCTGSGAVACWLQHAVPSVTVLATDIDLRAVACARDNGVHAFVGHLDDPLPADLAGSVDVLTAVVPYVPTEALPFLPRDVLANEPRQALDGGEGGLSVLIEMVERSVRWLRPGGWFLAELGGGQAAPVSAAMEIAGFVDVAVLRDEEGDDRLIEGRLPIPRNGK
jgi:release factor glutamine methyltransferase